MSTAPLAKGDVVYFARGSYAIGAGVIDKIIHPNMCGVQVTVAGTNHIIRVSANELSRDRHDIVEVLLIETQSLITASAEAVERATVAMREAVRKRAKFIIDEDIP